VIAEIDRLLDHHTEAAVADELNRPGLRSGTGQPFTPTMVHSLRVDYRLRSREQRLRQRGLVPLTEACAQLGVCPTTIKDWHHQGRITGQPLNHKGEHYYQLPTITPRRAIGRPPGTKNKPRNPTSASKSVANNPGGAV
jgi:hypothetical protein